MGAERLTGLDPQRAMELVSHLEGHRATCRGVAQRAEDRRRLAQLGHHAAASLLARVDTTLRDLTCLLTERSQQMRAIADTGWRSPPSSGRGAAIGWTTSGAPHWPGGDRPLDGLSDDDLIELVIEELAGTIPPYSTPRHPDDVDRAMVAITFELERRAWTDPDFARAVAAAIGEDGIQWLARVTSGELPNQYGHPGRVPELSDEWVYVASLLLSFSIEGDEGLTGAVWAAMEEMPGLVDLVDAHPALFARGDAAMIAAAVLTWSEEPTKRQVSAAVRIAGHDALLTLQLLADPDVARRVATMAEGDAARDFMVAALIDAPGLDPDDEDLRADATQLLADLAEIAQEDDDFTASVRQGIAMSLLPYLDDVTQDLDPPLGTDIVIGDRTVVIEGYDQLEALMGQLVADPHARLMLTDIGTLYYQYNYELAAMTEAGAGASPRTRYEDAVTNLVIGRANLFEHLVLDGYHTWNTRQDEAYEAGVASFDDLYGLTSGVLTGGGSLAGNTVLPGAGGYVGSLAGAGLHRFGAVVAGWLRRDRPEPVSDQPTRSSLSDVRRIAATSALVTDAALADELGVTAQQQRRLAHLLDTAMTSSDPAKAHAALNALNDLIADELPEAAEAVIDRASRDEATYEYQPS